MTLLDRLSMKKVHDHYIERKQIHHQMVELFQRGEVTDFAKLAVGIADKQANYSASEYRGGDLILQRSHVQAIYNLSQDLILCNNPKDIPDIIYKHAIPYLKISVGSEISMMLRPNDFWVANVRSIWAYLLIKHADNYRHANEELALYKDGERESEMDYAIWSEVHRLLETSQVRLYDLGVEAATKQNEPIGDLKYLWADAIANALYENRAARNKR